MPSSVAIRLAVEGGAEIKRVFDDAGRAGQQAFQSVSAAADAAGAATDRQTARYQRLADAARQAEAQARAQASVNALLGVGTPQAGAARASASVFEEQARAAETANIRARAATDGWRDLGSVGRTTLAQIETDRARAEANLAAARRLGSLGAVSAAANQNVPGGLRADQIQNLIYQGGDVLSSAASGMSPAMILMQQGPQIAQTFAGPGGASVKDVVSKASEAVSGFVSRIGLLGAAIGGATAVIGTGLYALSSYRSQQRDIDLSLAGAGRASGASLGQINAIALAAAPGAGLSTSAARDAAAQFAATGRIGTAMYADLIRVSRDYAIITRQEVPDATKALADAFADPARGAATLNAQLGFLDAKTKETIERLDQQGNRLGAQKALFDAMASSVAGARDRLGFFAREWEAFKTNTGNEFDAIGRFIDRGLGGGAAEEQLAALQGQLDFRQRNMGRAGGMFDRLLGFDVDTIKKQIAEVQAEIDRAAKAGTVADLAARSQQVDALVKSLNPGAEALKQIEDRAEQIRKYLADGGIDKDGSSRRAMEGLREQARQLREDMQRGGAAYADATRSATFQRSLVGASPFVRTEAEINKAQDDRRLNAFREAASDTSTDRLNKALASIEEDRKTLLDTFKRQTTSDAANTGGAFARASASLQQQFMAAARGAVTPGLIAGIAGKESTNNPNVGFSRMLGEDGRPSSAYGLGQITKGTAEQAIREGYLPQGFDRMNTATMAEGIAGVLQMKIDQNGGDRVAGLMAYRGSRDPAINRAYAAEVMRKAGEFGDVSSSGLVRDQDALNRAQRDASENLRNLNDNYGRNGQALEAFQARQQKYNELIDRGVPAAEAASIAFSGLTDKIVELGRSGRAVQFSRDMAFEREQLGRSAIEQQAYANARSRLGDTTSPESRAMIRESTELGSLREARSTLTDAATGFASDLRRGASAADAAANALSRISDKVINGAIDSVIGSLFKSGAGGSSPIGSFMSSIFGGLKFDGGGYTGPGERLEVAGLVHRGEVVWSQDDVRRWGGVGVVDAMRRGARGYAEGGIVGREVFTMPRAMAPAANVNAGPPSINFITPPGVQLEPDGPPQRRSDGSYEQALRTVENGLAGRASRGRGPFRQAAGGAWSRSG